MTAYNGHRSWNAWNVALWINNDEGLYNWARGWVRDFGRTKASRMLARALEGQTTPDGAKYNYTCIYEALEDIL